MLRLVNLEAGYGGLRVLKGISLHVSPGEVVGIIGANGAGKTTLLKTIAGILQPRSGSILFDKRGIHGRPAERIVELGCSLVPEGRHVFATMTVRENLILGAYPRRGKRRSSGAVAAGLDEVCGLFPILKERGKQLAGTLSGGQQQMLAIGRALMSGPRLLMMDEPSLGVAPLVVRDIYNTIASLKQKGLTILLVEQNARAALAVADRGYVIETGQIVLEGTSKELSDNREVQRAYLGKEYERIDEDE
jgi:branched-chain amino acid transport system ATP-binding protein